MHDTTRDPALGRRDPRQQLLQWTKYRVVHPEWSENLCATKLIERTPADAMHDFTEHFEIDVAVAELRPGRVGHRFRADQFQRLRRAAPRRDERQIRAQPRRVCEQLPDRDHLLPLAAKLRPVSVRRRVQFDLPLLDQLHHRRSRRDNLRKRGRVKYRVLRRRFARRLDGSVPKRLVIRHAVMLNPENAARTLARFDGARNRRVNLSELVASKNVRHFPVRNADNQERAEPDPRDHCSTR